MICHLHELGYVLKKRGNEKRVMIKLRVYVVTAVISMMALGRLITGTTASQTLP